MVDRVPDEEASSLTTVSYPHISVTPFFQLSVFLVDSLRYCTHIGVSQNLMPWDMRISWHWCTFKCGKVLMVVGAGRGPLVRASLQVSPCSFFIMGCQLVCLFWESCYMYQLYFDWTLFFFSFCLYIGSWRNRTQTENLCCGEKSKCSCYSSCVLQTVWLCFSNQHNVSQKWQRAFAYWNIGARKLDYV